jgi:hypothetical protein
LSSAVACVLTHIRHHRRLSTMQCAATWMLRAARAYLLLQALCVAAHKVLDLSLLGEQLSAARPARLLLHQPCSRPESAQLAVQSLSERCMRVALPLMRSLQHVLGSAGHVQQHGSHESIKRGTQVGFGAWQHRAEGLSATSKRCLHMDMICLPTVEPSRCTHSTQR